MSQSTAIFNQSSANPELQSTLDSSPLYNSIQDEVAAEQEKQAVKWKYFYCLNDVIIGGQSKPFFLTIEQGTDFKSCEVTGSAFYCATPGTTINGVTYNSNSAFPMPNGGGNLAWASRGLQVMITDTRSGRTLTNNFVPFESLFSPGYGLNYQNTLDLRYFLYRNSKFKFDIRNNDTAPSAMVAGTAHYFNITLHGYKILTP